MELLGVGHIMKGGLAFFQVFLDESDHSSADLDGYLVRRDFVRLFDENQRPELRIVVEDPELVLFAVELDIGVEPRYRDIGDPRLALVAAALGNEGRGLTSFRELVEGLYSRM